MKNCTNSFLNWIEEQRFLTLLLIFLMLPYVTLKAQELAKPADAFVESIGIGDRFDWLNDDGLLPKAQIALSSLKIRYVRIGIAAQSGSSTYIPNSKNMASALGAKLCVVTDVYNTWSTQQAWLDTWRGYAGTYAVEGPNEVGNFPAVAGIQQNIWNYANPLGLEVYAWTLGAQAGYYRTEGISNGGATVDNYCDYLNFHPYHWYSYNYDASKMNGLWQNGDFDNLGFGTSGCIDQVRAMANNPSKPFVSTEFGWCINDLEQGVGINYAKKYVARNCFENFNSGMHRGFIFSLTDYAGSGADYALASARTGALNATGQAVANMISILQEPGKNNITTTSLSYSLSSISGAAGQSSLTYSDDRNMQNDEIHHTLLQKSNGVFYLVLWSDYDSHNGEDGWAQNAILNLPAGAISVKAYLPLNGTSVVRDFGSVVSGGTVSLNSSTGTAIPDHPLVIEITTGTSNVAVTSVSVSPTSSSLATGGTQQLTPAVLPTNATNQNVTWSSSNTGIATVNASGLVTGVSVGSATITVTSVADGTKTATSAITVTVGCGTTVTSDNFDSGFGNWVDGGTDAARINDAAYANSGTYSLQLRDNTSTSVISTNNLDLSSYSSIAVSFTYTTISMDGGEDFWLQISTNGGSSYSTVKTYTVGSDFNNGTRYVQMVTLNGPFTSTSRLRFRNDASADDDVVYIDDVVVKGCTSGSGTTTNIENTDAGWSWNGYTLDPCTTCSGGSAHSSPTVGHYGQYTFTGNKLEAYAETYSGAGSIEILVDNISKGVFSQNITPYGGATLFATVSNLTQGVHTVRFVQNNSSWAGIDYIRVFSSGSGSGRLRSSDSQTVAEEITDQSISVYPNPATNFVTIDFNSDLKNEKAKVEMIDLLGRKVYDSGIFSNVSTLQINTSGYTRGNYLIRIKKGTEQVTKKLMIE